MYSNNIQQIKQAMKQGAFDNAHRIGINIPNTSNYAQEASVLICLSQLGMSNINDINPSLIASELGYSFQKLFNSLDSIKKLETICVEYIDIINGVKLYLDKAYKMADDNLEQQYRGSSGISLDSDDPHEREKAQRDKEHNNNINRQRQALKTKYESIVVSPYDCIVNNVIASKFANIKHDFSLSFCDILQTVSKLCSEKSKNEIQSFVALIKKARNQYYWSVNASQKQAYLSERERLEIIIQDILTVQINESKRKIDSSTKEKEEAKKERRRYALFNRTDRKPLSIQINNARKIIKNENDKLEKLKKGICPECDSHRNRIKYIDEELSKQR